MSSSDDEDLEQYVCMLITWFFSIYKVVRPDITTMPALTNHMSFNLREIWFTLVHYLLRAGEYWDGELILMADSALLFK